MCGKVIDKCNKTAEREGIRDEGILADIQINAFMSGTAWNLKK
jgi:hypothetical protein